MRKNTEYLMKKRRKEGEAQRHVIAKSRADTKAAKIHIRELKEQVMVNSLLHAVLVGQIAPFF